MMPVAKSLGKAAAMKAAEQVQNKTGLLGRNVIDPRQQIITYHGSPHTFPPTANNPLGEFDPMKVGTGEGAQAYGTGAAYLAEAKKLAEGYAGANAGRAAASDGLIDLLPKPAQMEVYKAMQMTDGPFKKAKIDDIVSRFPESSPVFQANTGNLYKVDLPDEHVAKMLDWDKPMTESEMTSIYDKMQQGPLNSFAKPFQENFYSRMERGSPATDGQDLFMELSKELGGQKYASNALQNMGITGIRYLDAASRDAAGKGTSNFVVFDPKHMNILERNGVGGAMIQRPKTEFEILHDTAQRNAALPVEQGGLGLPANNTYIDRANAPGMFPTDAYHGGNSLIKEADYLHSGKGNDQYGSAALHTASDPSISNGYVNQGESGGNIMPLRINREGHIEHDKAGNLTSSQVKKLIQSSPDEYALSNFGDVNYEGLNKVLNNAVASYKGVGDDTLLTQMNMINNDFYTGHPQKFNEKIGDLTGIKGLNVDVGGGNQFYLSYKPENIRSRFAAFDPFRRHEADILAGVGVGGMLDPQAIAEALRQRDRK
jgi:hypothetical protein